MSEKSRVGLGNVTVVVFLVYDYHPYVLERSKNRTPRAQSDFGFSSMQSEPLVVPFPVAHSAVQQSHGVSETTPKKHQHLRRKTYFGNEHNSRTPFFQYVGNKAHIYFRLAASRHSVQKCSFVGVIYFLVSPLLVGR